MSEKIKIPRAKKGFGRVEFIECKAEILDLRSKGHTLRSIYAYLKQCGKISMSYSVFAGYVKKAQHVEKTDNIKISQKKDTEGEGFALKITKADKFKHNKMPYEGS